MKNSFGARVLVFPTPVWVVGTYDRQGKANAMTAAWAGVVCSKPPCLGVCLRKATYTYGNILERKAFTVNVPSVCQARQADYLGLASGRDADKFAVAGLTPQRAEFVDAPFVAEFPLVVECSLLQSVEIGLHTQFIGEIRDVKADAEVLGERGLPDLVKVAPLLYAPEVRRYYAAGELVGEAFDMGKRM